MDHWSQKSKKVATLTLHHYSHCCGSMNFHGYYNHWWLTDMHHSMQFITICDIGIPVCLCISLGHFCKLCIILELYSFFCQCTFLRIDEVNWYSCNQLGIQCMSTDKEQSTSCQFAALWLCDSWECCTEFWQIGNLLLDQKSARRDIYLNLRGKFRPFKQKQPLFLHSSPYSRLVAVSLDWVSLLQSYEEIYSIVPVFMLVMKCIMNFIMFLKALFVLFLYYLLYNNFSLPGELLGKCEKICIHIWSFLPCNRSCIKEFSFSLYLSCFDSCSGK